MGQNYFSKVIDDIKNVAKDCAKATNTRILFGTVTSTEPLEIRLDSGMVLRGDAVYTSPLCENQRFENMVTLRSPITVQTAADGFPLHTHTVTIPAGTVFSETHQQTDGALQVGDRVMMNNCNDNQRYHVLRKVNR